MNVIILAAGQGRRMHSDLPKVLHRLAGRPLVMHVLSTVRALGANAGASRVVVVTGHGGERVREVLAGEGVEFAAQEPQLGTGHAVMQALPLLDDAVPTLVLYGDVPLIRAKTLEHLVDAARGGDGAWRLAVLTVELPDPQGYGRIIRERGTIRRIVEQKDGTPAELAVSEVNTGILIAPTAKLRTWLARLSNDNAQREYYLTDIVAMAVAEGMPVGSAHPTDTWETLGVNSRAQLAELERIHQGGIARELLEAGVALADPGRIDVRGRLACGRDVAIDVNCVFEGEVLLADGVSIGPNCVLKNVRLGPGTRVEAFSHLEDAAVGAEARIGPYARLRPGAKLADQVHIGNFVEVKASEIGVGSKASHLAYIGDSSVGRNVNIGAGTITCNYDGVNKHRTIIEDDAFIGSDSQLVAPVRVGRGATLGAGTTLVDDAPEGQLTVSRARQVSIARWKRPVKKSKSG